MDCKWVEYSFDAINQFNDIMAAAADGNQIKFQAALDAAKVKVVVDAETQAQLLTALQANFELVNPDWIVEKNIQKSGVKQEKNLNKKGVQYMDFSNLKTEDKKNMMSSIF